MLCVCVIYTAERGSISCFGLCDVIFQMEKNVPETHDHISWVIDELLMLNYFLSDVFETNNMESKLKQIETTSVLKYPKLKF